MKKITIKQYKDLKAGDIYIFRSFGKKGSTDQRGKLISVHTRWRDKKDEEGKVIGRDLVGDTVIFEPINKFHDWNGEKLKVYTTTIGCGLFQIFRECK